EDEIRGLVYDGGGRVVALVQGVARPGREVQHIEVHRGPGELAEGGIAVRFRPAVALDEERTRGPSLVSRRDGRDDDLAVDRITGAVNVPLVRRRCRRKFGDVFVEIVESDHVIDLPERADRLELL